MTLPRTGFIDHIGIGVPDLAAAKEYYDDLMSVLGLRQWFETGPEGPLNYGPDALLCHLLARSSRNQARGGLPQSRTELVGSGVHHRLNVRRPLPP